MVVMMVVMVTGVYYNHNLRLRHEWDREAA